jgi:hypothetical protein
MNKEANRINSEKWTFLMGFIIGTTTTKTEAV